MPVEAGQKMEVEIVSFDALGRGIAWVDNTMVIVPGGLVGRKHLVEIVEVKTVAGKQVAYARVVV